MEVLEKVRDAREETHALDTAFFCLLQKRSKKQTAGAMPLGFRANDDGAHLSEMWPVHMKRSAADELMEIGLNDSESVDVFANFHVGPMQQSSVVRKPFYKVMDNGYIG
jgi:hypothetical protein